VTFDPVHDTQAVHRALVKAFSFPGTPVSIGGPASRSPGGLPSTLGAVALTLLDAETSFFHSEPRLLTELTGARRRPDDEAAFLVVSEWDEGAWTAAFRRAHRGTLADPHRGASVVAWAPESAPGSVWTASGPGIETPIALTLPGTDAWVAARNEACVEFPLGVDLIWARVDSVVALPRTTRLVPGGPVPGKEG